MPYFTGPFPSLSSLLSFDTVKLLPTFEEINVKIKKIDFLVSIIIQETEKLAHMKGVSLLHSTPFEGGVLHPLNLQDIEFWEGY